MLVPAEEGCQAVELIKQSCSVLLSREAQKHTRLTVVRQKNGSLAEGSDRGASSSLGYVTLIKCYFFLIKI